MTQAFSEWVIRWRWAIIVCALLIVLAAASGTRRLVFIDNYRVFFSKENPDLQAFELVENVYTKNDNILFVIAPKDGQVFTRETLAGVEWLTREAWKLPYSTRVDSLTNFQHTWAQADNLVVQNLAENAANLSDADLERIKSLALAEPLLVNLLISPRAHVTGVNVITVLPQKSITEVPEVAARARELVREIKARNPNLDVHLTGSTMMNNAFTEHGQNDFQTLMPMMYGIIILTTFFILRSVTGTLVTVLAIVISTLSTMGLAGWLGIRLTPVSVSVPTIIMTVAVADCMHLLLSILQGMRHGLDKRAAISAALKLNLKTLLLTAVNTIIGFLTLNFNDVPPYRDLGNMVAIGVAVAFLFTIVFLPALLAVLPMRAKAAPVMGEVALDRLADFTIQRRKPLLWGISLISLVLIGFAMRNEFHDDFAHYFSQRTEIRRANNFAEANLRGPYDVHYSLGAGQSGGVSDPQYLRKLEEFAEWCGQQPEVIHVYSISEILKRLNRNLHGDEASYYRIPDSQELAAQYLLLYEMSVPFGLDLNDRINVDKSATRLTLALKTLPTKAILAFEDRAETWLREHAPEAMFARGTGPTIMFGRIGKRSTESMVAGDLLGVLTIAIVMVLVLRSFKFGLITMLPNLLPAGMAFGLWGIFVGRLGMDAAPVTGATLGILVDDTTHNMSKYLYARRTLGLSPARAVRYVFSTVGVATLAASLILVAGFSVLAFSAFQFNSTMGLLSALIIAIGGLAEFLLMPPLLLKLEEKEHEKDPEKDAEDAVVAKPVSVPA
jgi:uncharacterized protein